MLFPVGETIRFLVAFEVGAGGAIHLIFPLASRARGRGGRQGAVSSFVVAWTFQIKLCPPPPLACALALDCHNWGSCTPKALNSGRHPPGPPKEQINQSPHHALRVALIPSVAEPEGAWPLLRWME